MYQVKADIKKNRLYITIGDSTDENEREMVIHEIHDVLQNLKNGFDCITDLRGYKVLLDENEEFIYRAQKKLTDAGLSNVVRVVKKFGSFGHFQFDKVSTSVGYHAQNANTMEEAEQILDLKKKMPS